MSKEVEKALEATGRDRESSCNWIRRARKIVEAVRAETPGWKVWETTPLRIAIGVLTGIEHALCGR